MLLKALCSRVTLGGVCQIGRGNARGARVVCCWGVGRQRKAAKMNDAAHDDLQQHSHTDHPGHCGCCTALLTVQWHINPDVATGQQW